MQRTTTPTPPASTPVTLASNLSAAASASLPALQTAGTAAVSFFSTVATLSAPVVQAASSTLASAATATTTYFTTPAPPPAAASSSSPASDASTATAAAATPQSAGDKQKKPKPKGRDTTTYERNITAALALPDTPPKPKHPTWLGRATTAVSSMFFTPPSQPAQQPSIRDQIKALHSQRLSLPKENLTDAQKKELDRLTLEKINLLEDRVIEHAARRTDLFFYACIAVYKTKAVISDGPTIEQHGKGSKLYGTAACHSALFSNLQLATLLNKHLPRTNNMTVELPTEVNDFDKHIERSGFVDNMIVILNKVSQGTLNPQQAMTEYLKNISYCFEKFNTKYLYEDSITDKPQVTQDTIIIRTQLMSYRRIWELERTGTFKAAIQGQEVKEIDPHYINLLLPKFETIKESLWYKTLNIIWDSHSELEVRVLKLQDEINSVNSTFSPSPRTQ